MCFQKLWPNVYQDLYDSRCRNRERKKPKKISAKVEITTPFPGGDSSWIQSLEGSLNRSISFKNKAKAGKYIAFCQISNREKW